MGVFKSKYYVGLSEDECAENDVETLHKAMRGLGTDEADLIRTLCFKNNDHLRRVNLLFEQKYGARGNLQKWIIDDTSGDFQKLMIAIAQEEAEMIADALYKAMKGLGTDDDLIINTLATRSPVEIERAAKVFERKYPGEDLRKWINDDTSGDYKKVLLALLDRKAYFCRELHKAISGLGTDDDQLIRMITSMKHHDEVKRIVSEFEDPLGFALDITTQLEMEFSTPTIREVAECYERMYGQSLKAALAGDTSGLYGKLILGLMEDQASRDADLLRKACAGAGTDDEALISFLVTKGEKEREALGKAYVQKFGRTVADEIGSETSFNYKQVLTALAKPKAMVVAEALRKTMKGAGTDERALIYLLVHRSKKEIREIYKAYESLFQRDLIKDIESETFGWFQKCLVFMVRESIAERPRTHLPFSLMHLARDVDR